MGGSEREAGCSRWTARWAAHGCRCGVCSLCAISSLCHARTIPHKAGATSMTSPATNPMFATMRALVLGMCMLRTYRSALLPLPLVAMQGRMTRGLSPRACPGQVSAGPPTLMHAGCHHHRSTATRAPLTRLSASVVPALTHGTVQHQYPAGSSGYGYSQQGGGPGVAGMYGPGGGSASRHAPPASASFTSNDMARVEQEIALLKGRLAETRWVACHSRRRSPHSPMRM